MSISRCTLLSTLLSLFTATTASTTLGPIEIQGYKFFDSNTGDEFVVKGIDYFPRPNQGKLNYNSADLFTDEHREVWERDVEYLKELGVNTVRLYAVDASKNHDQFMCALNEAGIYVIVALAHDCPTCAVTRDESPDCYPTELKIQGQDVINAFAKYPNTLAFSAGNEVNHFSPLNMPEWNAPCQKKFLRDMREYIDSCENLRNVPIGLVSADDFREDMAKYYNCQDDPNDQYQAADWYGLNSYVFCDGTATSYDQAGGFQILEHSFRSYNYSIPVVLTEFGCLSPTFEDVDGFESQRNFMTAKWMLEEPSLRDMFSGGLVFEYSIEMENAKSESPYPFHKFGHQNYGVGYFGPEHCDDTDTPCEYHPTPTYDMLKKQYTTSKPVNVAHLNSFEALPGRMKRSECPSRFKALSEFEWEADSTPDRQCPAKGQESSFTCPATYTPKIVAVSTKSTDNDNEVISNDEKSGQTFFFDIVLCIFCLAVLIVSAVCWAVYRKRHGQKVPEWLLKSNKTLGKSFVSGNDSDSEESAGLLSMKSYQKGLGPDYQAIDSDSSSEDLQKKNVINV